MSSANNTKKVRVIIRSSNCDMTRGGSEGWRTERDTERETERAIERERDEQTRHSQVRERQRQREAK
jgi:hypothetical protein